MTDVFSHPWLSGLFGDPETADLWSAEATLAHMIAFEAAWSRAGHLAGLWSRAEGAAAAKVISEACIDPADLREGTARDGVCVPELVRLLKNVAGDGAVHTGATSQDVIDSATVLSLVATLDLFEGRLKTASKKLDDLNAAFGAAPLMGRTRMQAAHPVSVSHRIQAWRMPLERHIARLKALRPKLAVIQIGGATGDRAALGRRADEFCDAVASELGLHPTSEAWHSARDGFSEAASVFSLISGTLGKLGQDIALMAQQGVDDVVLRGGGASSSMPHKQNPVLAELLVALARFNATQLSSMHQSLVHEQERSGAAWSLEWLVLPQMAQTSGRALNASIELVDSIERIGQA